MGTYLSLSLSQWKLSIYGHASSCMNVPHIINLEWQVSKDLRHTNLMIALMILYSYIWENCASSLQFNLWQITIYLIVMWEAKNHAIYINKMALSLSWDVNNKGKFCICRCIYSICMHINLCNQLIFFKLKINIFSGFKYQHIDQASFCVVLGRVFSFFLLRSLLIVHIYIVLPPN